MKRFVFVFVLGCLLVGCHSGVVTPNNAASSSVEQVCGPGGIVCPQTHFCLDPQNTACGDKSNEAVCVPYPESCTREYKPVCGCDAKSYGNACVAYSYGVSIQSFGVCGSDPTEASAVAVASKESGGVGSVCGTRGAVPCGKGLFCNFPESAQCGAADQPGQCAAIRRGCTRDLRPVCGCDDKTYGNECAAHASGVSVKQKGRCDEAPTATKACVRGGCSGELCMEEGTSMASTCMWRDEFACYTKAKCERQSTGQCAFSSTKALQSCLANPPKAR